MEEELLPSQTGTSFEKESCIMFFISTTNDRTVNRMVNSLCRHERDENGALVGDGEWGIRRLDVLFVTFV